MSTHPGRTLTEHYGGTAITVTATDWAVSRTTGTEIDGCQLNVHKTVPGLNEFGGEGIMVFHPLNGSLYPTDLAASQAAIDAGLLKLYKAAE